MTEEKKPKEKFAVGQQAKDWDYFVVDTETDEKYDTLGALTKIMNDVDKIKKSLG